MKRKESRYRCQKCSFKTNGPKTLGVHYDKNPSHQSLRSVYNRTYRAKCRARRLTKKGSTLSSLPQTKLSTTPIVIRYCTQCGTKSKPTWKFCGHCGAKI